MAHIHLPDGVFSIQWVLFWWLLALALLFAALMVSRRHTIALQRLAVAGMLAAASFAIFQINVPYAGGVHMNLTPLIGILAGPALGSLIIFIVNVLSAAVGHGGWGLIGANTIINMSEIFVAFYVFKATQDRLEMFTRGALAAIAGLLVGNAVFVLIILVSGIQGTQLSGVSLLLYVIQVPILNFIVAVVEAIVTGFVVDYLAKVRPDLIQRFTHNNK
ncbi:MAG: energy-coupling factor ABC transporter permease [Halobacteriota archaeon]